MVKLIRRLRRRPILSSWLVTLGAALIHLLTYYLYIETKFASPGLIISAVLYGTILFPVYYALTFSYFFACIYYINSEARPFIIASVIIYFILTIPFVDMNLIRFGF